MNTGSPILARINLNLSMVLIVALGILALFAVLYFIARGIEKYRDSKAYAEKNKDRKTTAKEINSFAKKAELEKEEKEILYHIFKAHPLPNINFAIKDPAAMEQYLKEEFTVLDTANDETGKKAIFTLRNKISKTVEPDLTIKDSKLIPLKTAFTFTPSQGIHFALVLVESTPGEMHFLLPQDLPQEDKPQILSKVTLIFVYKNSLPYEIEARVVRYQKGKNNSDIMVCGHTDRIKKRKKRLYPRLELRAGCRFSFASIEKTENGEEYKTSGKVHEGILADSSAGGCRIITKLPIKPEQYITIRAPFDGNEEEEATGFIIRTTKNKNEEYIIHIKFVRISDSTANRINAAACGYKTI